MLWIVMLFAPVLGCGSTPPVPVAVSPDEVPMANLAPDGVAAPAAGMACDSDAYVRLGAGPVPVFASPDAAGTPIGDIPAATALQHASEPDSKGMSGGPRVHLAGTAPGGWVLYDSVETLGELDPTAAPAPARGWIRHDDLHVDLAMSEVSPALSPPWKVPLRESPSTTAPVVRTYEQETHRARVLSCRGTWLEVSIELLGTEEPPATGWLHELDTCSHPFTTCGLKGNSLEHASDEP